MNYITCECEDCGESFRRTFDTAHDRHCETYGDECRSCASLADVADDSEPASAELERRAEQFGAARGW